MYVNICILEIERAYTAGKKNRPTLEKEKLHKHSAINLRHNVTMNFLIMLT